MKTTIIKFIAGFIVFNGISAMATGYFKCENDTHDPRHAAETFDGAKALEAKHHCGKWGYHQVSGHYDQETIQKALGELNKGGKGAAVSDEPNLVKPGLEKPAGKEPANKQPDERTKEKEDRAP